MGRGGDEYYLPHPHTLLPFIYPLPYPYPSGMRNRIPSPSPTGSGKKMLSIDDYGEGEEKGRECEIWKEKRENYDK
ncbi:hypothetical protein MTR_1g044730 [Medicago truncatula]|uniref:Uncharacterized protein n=1 Tax=Medicago truncatula TaxID=3880 RepID=G7I633_MEDTR|nr:hypothetical protein MTR_1g044730 [Medicago truncatula]